MATFGYTTQPGSSWQWSGSNTENQVATPLLTMPAGGGTVTSIVFYAKGYNTTTTAAGVLWNSSGGVMVTGSTVSLPNEGGGAVGGQQWNTSGISSGYYIPGGTQFRIGWWRNPSQSCVWSTGSGTSYGCTNTSGSPGGFSQTYSFGSVGAYINYSTTAAPSVSDNAPSSITSTSVYLSGTVNPNGLSTTYQFQYGTTSSYGSGTTQASAGSGATGQGVSATVSGLSPSTTYYWQLVASNADGTTSVAGANFTTSANPESTPALIAPGSGSYVDLAGTPTFTWQYTSGASGGQTGYIFQRTDVSTAATQYWNASTSTWSSTSVSNSSSSQSLAFPANAWATPVEYNWTVATVDANGTSPFAPGATVYSETAPLGPTLLGPPDNTAANLNSGYTFQWQYNPQGQAPQTGYIFARVISGTTTYWNAATGSFQSTSVVNTSQMQQTTITAGNWATLGAAAWNVGTVNAVGTTYAATAFNITNADVPNLQPHAYRFTVAGTDYTGNFEQEQWTITENFGKQGDTATFYLTDVHPNGQIGADIYIPPLAAVELYDLTTGNQIYGGMVNEPKQYRPTVDQSRIELNCVDWTYLADSAICNYTYVNQTADAIIVDLVNNRCLTNPGLNCALAADGGYVQPGPVVPVFVASYIQLSSALQQLATLASGLTDYAYSIDMNRNVWFLNQDQALPSGVTFSDVINPANSGYASPTYAYYETSQNSYYDVDGTTIRTACTVLGALSQVSQTDYWVSNGQSTAYPLTYDVSQMTGQLVLTINGTVEQVSVLQTGIPATTPYVITQAASGQWFLMGGTHAGPVGASGNNMSLKYTANIPLVARYVNMPLANMYASPPYNMPNGGVFEVVISDPSINNWNTAFGLAQRECQQYGPVQERMMLTTTEDWGGDIHVGYTCTFVNSTFTDLRRGGAAGINDTFLVVANTISGKPGAYRTYELTMVRV